MATKNMAYDNAAYLAVLPVALGTLTGNAGATQRFTAFATCLIKSINTTYYTAGTGASTDIKSLYVISQGTATTTTVLHTRTIGAVGVTQTLGTATMSRGDVCYVAKGTDATEASAVGLEIVLLPGADVTA